LTYYTEQIDYRLQPTGYGLEVVHDRCLLTDDEGVPLDPPERERFRWAQMYSLSYRPCSRCGEPVL